MKFSICIPTYNRSELVVNAINSAIDQDYHNIEVIVVDNNSEQRHLDHLLTHCKNLSDRRVKIHVNEKNLGMFGNWNKCLELASGDYITILSDDDLLHNKFLSCMKRHIDFHPASAFLSRRLSTRCVSLILHFTVSCLIFHFRV